MRRCRRFRRPWIRRLRPSPPPPGPPASTWPPVWPERRRRRKRRRSGRKVSGGSRRLWRGASLSVPDVGACFFFSAQRKKSSGAGLDPEGLNVEVGDQVLVAGQKNGIVRFYGKTDFAPGASAALGRSFLLPRCQPSCFCQNTQVSASLQVTGSAWSWTSQRGNTTAPCSESVTSAVCPNMECLLRPPACRGTTECLSLAGCGFSVSC